MIHVIAIITARDGMREKVLESFRAVMPHVQAEEGCVEYTATVDADSVGAFQTMYGENCLVLWEKWENAEALNAHLATPHMAAHFARVKDMIADRAIHVLSPA